MLFNLFPDEFIKNFEMTMYVRQQRWESRFTPDAVALEKQRFHHMFVFNEWMTGMAENVSLGSARKRHDGITKERFQLWKVRVPGNPYPILLSQANFDVPSYPVHGEVFTVPTATIFELDKLIENNIFFKRKKIKVAIPYREVLRNKYGQPNNPGKVRITGDKFHVVNMWTYIGINDYWVPQLDGRFNFKPVKWYGDPFHPYYKWTNDELIE